MKTPSDTN